MSHTLSSLLQSLGKSHRAWFIFGTLAALWSASLAIWGPSSLIFPDAMEYADMARGLSRGEGLRDRAIWIYQLSFSDEAPSASLRRAPLHPMITSLAFRIFGANDRVAILASLFFFFSSALTLFGLVRRLSDSSPGSGIIALVAGCAALVDPQSLILAVSGLSEPLFTLALLLIASQIIREPYPLQWLQIGVLVGLSQWIRLNGFVLLIPCLCAAWVMDRASFRRNALMLALGAALPLLILAHRNYRALGQFSFVGVNGAILYNEIGGLTAHGIERKMYLPPDAPPNLLWILDGKLPDFLSKFFRGFQMNLGAALSAATPLAWGATLLRSWTRWDSMPRSHRALTVFTISSALLWVGLFAVGEFEGARFFVPLTPLLLALAALAFADFVPSDLVSGWRWAGGLGLFALVLLPGTNQAITLLGSKNPSASFTAALGKSIQSAIPPEAVVLSDAPWATAWYGDRCSVWIPARVEEMPRVTERCAATHLILTQNSAANDEIEARWRDILLGREPAPANWTPINAGPLEGAIRIYNLR